MTKKKETNAHQYQLTIEDVKATKAELVKEIARPKIGGLRSPWRDSAANALTPTRMAAILRDADINQADEYLTLAEELEERDAHYRSALTTRKMAVASLPMTITPASESADDIRLAQACEDVIHNPRFKKSLMGMLDAIAKGYSVTELVWRTASTPWMPAAYHWRDPRFFIWDQTEGTTLLLKDDAAPMGRPMPTHKFVTHVTSSKCGLPLRGGVARVCAIMYLAKSYSIKDWLSFAEVFGMPLRIGKYHPGATESDINGLLAALGLLGTDAVAAIPTNMLFEVHSAAQGAGGDKLFAGLADFANKEISKAVLGQTMTSEDGSSLAQASVHNEIRQDIIDSDAEELTTTINEQLIRPFIDLNYGERDAYPTFSLKRADAEDLALLSTALTPFIDRGLRVSEAEIRAKFGLDEPAEGDTVLGMGMAPVGQPQAAQEPEEEEEEEAPGDDSPEAEAMNRAKITMEALAAEANRPKPPPDAIDKLADDALDDWEPIIDPILEPVVELANRVSSLEEFQRQLPGVLQMADTSKLIESLALHTYIARGLGDATDDL